MPNTVNYSFPTPADTDLVKNGADAIRDLGDAVDTAMNTALGTKKSGLVLLNTTSFSAVSSQSINDVFSATYLHYVLVLTAISTNDTDINFRWRVSGADNSTSNYSWAQAGTFATTGTFSGGNANNAAQFRITGSNAANSQKFGTYTLYNPFATDTSGFTGHLSYSSGTANYFAGSIGGGFNGTTSFTGFTIYPTAGTITGSLSVYGVNK